MLVWIRCIKLYGDTLLKCLHLFVSLSVCMFICTWLFVRILSVGLSTNINIACHTTRCSLYGMHIHFVKHLRITSTVTTLWLWPCIPIWPHWQQNELWSHRVLIIFLGRKFDRMNMTVTSCRCLPIRLGGNCPHPWKSMGACRNTGQIMCCITEKKWNFKWKEITFTYLYVVSMQPL